jgi:hypothetical protein
MTGRLPGGRCIGCRRRLTETGGQRIVATGAVRVSVIGDNLHPSVEGSGLWWPWFARARARRAVRSGRRPWLCQRCTSVGLCRRCRTPYHLAPGADILTDDGAVLHVPLVTGMGLRCEQCDEQANWQPGPQAELPTPTEFHRVPNLLQDWLRAVRETTCKTSAR